jgi:hypothetical protein
MMSYEEDSVRKYFLERGRRADRNETLRVLDHAGKGKPPMPGDELPKDDSSSESAT